MAQALVVGSLLAGGASAYQSYEAGRVEKKVAGQNAVLMEQDANDALAAAKLDAALIRRQGRLHGSAQQADFTRSGVALEGSPLLALAETKTLSELDALKTEYGGELEARKLRQQADLTRYSGKQAARAGKITAAGTLLTSGLQAGGQFYTAREQERLAKMQADFFSRR